ncbi:MAG: lipopolysaccharide biosynthesis protein RfbH [Solirubrobacterales bacterium]|nr:lipopolysaccharide biosynthesis protein RfbH [Solirubrobacterales bacterium]
MSPQEETPELQQLRAAALEATRSYAEARFAERPFVAGETTVSVGEKVIGPPELENAVSAVLDAWLTEGQWAERFRAGLPKATGRPANAIVGSGSQANLLAISALRSHLIESPLLPGDEVITPAVGFPTTVNPIYQQGLIPVYVDVEPDTLNPTVEMIEAAIGPKTKAIVAAHCLGNPFDALAVESLCEERGLHLIEDCCDALGSELGGRRVGTFGKASTYSFYPAHHMTTGEGGAVGTEDSGWTRAVASLREWGRDCYCPPGVNNACGHRFNGQYGKMPVDYDHKYVFSHLGFNFKVTDMQAALGLAQLDRVEGFHSARRANFAYLDGLMRDLEDTLVLPRTIAGANPSWFGYPFTLRDGNSATRRDLQIFLEERKIDSRLLLAGNMTRQPAYLPLEHRVSGTLEGSDLVTDGSVWVGCHPGLTRDMIDWLAESIHAFFASR